MRNREVALNFIRRKIAHSLHLFSTGDRLMSYSTCIAQWYKDKLLINRTKYSITTSIHLNIMLRQLPKYINIENTYDIEKGTLWLRH